MSYSKENVKKRDANLDLLRIVSMLLIIFLHSIDHSGVLESAEASGDGMYFYVRVTYGLCMICVNCYVLLSGYYLVTSKFRVQKLIALWMETAFYAVVIRLLFILTGQRPFSIGSILSCFVPILTGRYWFVTIYVGLYLVSPFLNMAIYAMNRRQHAQLNLLLFFLFSVWASIHPSMAGMNSGGGWGLAWFVVLYLLAAWFRLYYKAPQRKAVWYLTVALAVPLGVATLQLLAKQMEIGFVQSIVKNWYRYDSAPVYVMTLLVFVGFLNMQIRSKVSGVISYVAPLTFGVYLIHAQADVASWLWNVLGLPAKMHFFWFPIFQLGSVILIFAVCAAIDELRRKTVGRIENARSVQSVSEKLTSFLQK